MTAAERRRMHRAIAGALAAVDALWSSQELELVTDSDNGPELLRERIVEALAGELELALHPEPFESLLDAVRMAG